MSKGTEVATRGTALEQPPTNGDGEVGGLLRLALEQKVPVEIIERLVALQERILASNARAAFVQAMAKFQSEVGPIPKTHAIEVDRAGVKQVRSRFAPLHVIAEHIREPLARNGLSYSWDSLVDGDKVAIICTVRHVLGHEQTSRFECRTQDAGAPGMSGVQIAGSARTYGERYSLVQGLGLTTADEDTDGRAPENGSADKITEKQAADLDVLLEEVGADKARFLAWLKVPSFADLPASDLQRAITELEQKRGKAKVRP